MRGESFSPGDRVRVLSADEIAKEYGCSSTTVRQTCDYGNFVEEMLTLCGDEFTLDRCTERFSDPTRVKHYGETSWVMQELERSPDRRSWHFPDFSITKVDTYNDPDLDTWNSLFGNTP